MQEFFGGVELRVLSHKGATNAQCNGSRDYVV